MELQKLLVTLALDAKDYTKGLDDASREAQGFGSRVRGGLGRAFGTIRTVGTAAFLGVGVAAAAGFGVAMREAINMNSTLETSTLQFGTLMGDSDKAQEHVANLFEFAAKTPFETGPIIAASKHLQVFGGDALNTMDNLTLVGDASAALGVPFDEAAFWIGRLYSNLQGGQPFGEAAMRLQEMGIMTPQARQELEALQKSGASADETFGTFQDQLGSFTGAMEAQQGTWAGLTSTITDQLGLLAAEALKPLFEVAKELLGALVALFNSPEVQAGIQTFAANLAAFATGLIEFITTAVVPFVQDHGPAIIQVLKVLAIAFGGLAIIGTVITLIGLLFSPIGLVVAAIAFLSAAWINDWGGIQEKTATAVAFIRSVIETALTAIRTFWEEHGEAIKAFTQNIWDAISALIEGVLTHIVLIGQAFKALFTGDWEALGEVLQEIWQNAWDTITEVLSNIWAAFRPILQSLWESIRNWWNGIDWASLGHNIIQGIIDGVKAMAGSLSGVLGDIVNAAIANIKRLLGIASPSKVFAEIGGDMMAGLSRGIMRNGDPMDAFFVGLSHNIAVLAGAPVTAGGSSVTDNSRRMNIYGGVNVNRGGLFESTLESLYGISQ